MNQHRAIQVYYIRFMFIALIVVFIIGYLLITVEQTIKIDKAAIALITGVVCWSIYIFSSHDKEEGLLQLNEHIGEIAGILFFLIGAMTIVELIDLYDGFSIIIRQIRTSSKRFFLLLITLLAFFLSAILDNLTTSIVMCSLVIKILSDKNDRLICIGMIVIAANAGGAWSAIGDVTTTMLWIGKQITVWGVAQKVFLPAVVATLIPLFILSRKLKGNFACNINLSQQGKINTIQSIVLFAGLGLLLMVPLIKIVTHLPPFMGMMLALGLLWILSEIIHVKAKHSDDEKNSIFSALERIDMPSILFFLGILLAVSCLQSAGVLQDLAKSLQTFIGDNNLIVGLIGFASAIFDNVPLVAAVQGMYSLQEFPMGDSFWNLLAYCAGTGGSILIIGSAAGVAAMGMEQISFFGYVKNISLAALLGYIAGFVLCVLV